MFFYSHGMDKVNKTTHEEWACGRSERRCFPLEAQALDVQYCFLKYGVYFPDGLPAPSII